MHLAGEPPSAPPERPLNRESYRVTLVKVIDPAQGADTSTPTPDSGKRFVGAVFRIKALKGSPQDEDANNDAVIVGSNGQTYSADLDAIAGYTNFAEGTIQLAQGDTTTGAVTFQVPDGVKVSKVQWGAGSDFGSAVQWDLQTPAAASTLATGSCRSQVSAWRGRGGAAQLETSFTDVETLSGVAVKLAHDGTDTAGHAGDQSATQGAAAKLQSDIKLAQSDLPPSCMAHMQGDAQAFFTDASETATEVSDAATAFGNGDYTTETRDFDTGNSWASKMDTELDAVGRDLKAYSGS